jgi:uncharacterized protein (TIGR03083 family)
MTMSATAPATAGPLRSGFDRPTAMRLAATEYARYTEHLRQLSTEDWNRPTDCPDWDVRAMATHVLGMADMAASVREGMRQRRAAMARGGVFIDALTALQVEQRAALRPEEIIARLHAVAPKAARGRRRTPWLIRRRQLSGPPPMPGSDETWTVGYLIDTILTRDPWMHRVDSTRATGAAMVLTPEHDGVLVADVVAEWLARHGQPCTLRLTGPAGGEWTQGVGGQHIELDAVEFCRILSGRAEATGLLAVAVPF